jgi:hypothetical protein
MRTVPATWARGNFWPARYAATRASPARACARGKLRWKGVVSREECSRILRKAVEGGWAYSPIFIRLFIRRTTAARSTGPSAIEAFGNRRESPAPYNPERK